MSEHPEVTVRPARTPDVTAIRRIVAPFAARRVLISREAVFYYETLAEMVVAEADGEVIACGALHTMWEDLAEVRTVAVAPGWNGRGVGGAVIDALVDKAKGLGVTRLFCLTFEVRFFTRHGFDEIEGTPVESEVYLQLLRSYDEGVAEFLDLERVKPNTLGNSRMLLTLVPAPREDLVRLVPYQPSWARAFATERTILSTLLPDAAVEHVGSTAVEGMPARPVIDVLLGVEPGADVAGAVAELTSHGYVVEGSDDHRTWLCRPAPGQRASTVEVVVHGSALWQDRVRFRDLLRTDPELRAAWAAHKQELASRDLAWPEYSAARRPFIQAWLART